MSEANELSNDPKRKTFSKALKVFAWILCGLVVLIVGAACFVSAWLTPERITKFIEEEADKHLLADVKIENISYTIFSSYPWLNFEVDSISIVSKSLQNISPDIKQQLPENADFLASVAKISGSVNIHDLIHDKITLRDIKVVKPKANIVEINDSVANYLIAKSLPKIKKIPEINKIGVIKLEAPIIFDFFSLQQDIEGAVNLENLSFTETDGKNADIKLELTGTVGGRYRDYKTPGDILVKLNTQILPDLLNLTVLLKNLSLSIAGLGINTNGEIIANKNAIELNQADFNIHINDLFSLLEILPPSIKDKVKLPDGLKGILPISLSASLNDSYHISLSEPEKFSLHSLPSLTAQLKVEDADIVMSPPGEKSITADDIFVDVWCDFNPQNPEATNVVVKELRMKGEGIDLSGQLSVDHILSEEQTFNGNLSLESPLVKTLAYFLPGSSLKIAGFLKGNVTFSGNSLNYGKEGFKDLALDANVQSNSLKVNYTSIGNISFKNIIGDLKANIPVYPSSNYAGTKLALNLSADSTAYKASGTNVSLSGLKLDLDATEPDTQSPQPSGDLLLKIKSLNARMSGTSLSAKDVNLMTHGSLTPTPSQKISPVAETSGGDDALIASRSPHTPLILTSNGGMLQTLMNMISLNAELEVAKAFFKSPLYLYPVDCSGLYLSTDLNSVEFSAGEVGISQTGFGINGRVTGLQPFLTTMTATPITASAEIDFSNVDINQLSWGYYGAQLAAGNDSAFSIPAMTPFTASDSVCVAIPRNIDANIRLRSHSAQYMQFNFSPLSTDILVKDGAATLRKLTVGTPYCTAIVDWTFSTANLSNIFMDLQAKIRNFEFEPFYNIFPTIVEKVPELHNFTGQINADIGCDFLMFPDMFMNGASLKGDFNVRGTELQFARQGKIEKITHLMLIEGDEPIHLQNLDITGTFHDNLLQVNPFKVSFDEYQLEFAGINNLSGDMFYHIALEKSPFHLPFGVSLMGKFPHPEVKLGGTHIDNYRSFPVTSDLNSKLDVNIMAYLRHGWLIFIQEAAKYQQKQPGTNSKKKQQ